MTAALLSRTTKAGIVDMVAVARWVKGDDVALTDAERDVAIHAARDAGHSIDRIARRLRTSDQKIKDVLATPVPVDSRRRPLTLTIKL